MNDSNDLVSGIKIRLIVLSIFIILLFFIILLHLFNIQITENRVWEKKAKAFSSRTESLQAQRGLIWDRNVDTPLASNVDSFTLSIIPGNISLSDPALLASRLYDKIGISEELILDRIPEDWTDSWNPVKIRDGLSFDTIVSIAESYERFPGVIWQSKPYRWYNSTGSISHILGYTGNITVEELQLLYNEGYENTANLGKSGVEKNYDGILRGKNGFIRSNVDASGRGLGRDDDFLLPVNGNDIVLTIDRHLQELAERALGPRKGSLVVLKPSTGELLAMVSYPSFDPNQFYTSSKANFNSLSVNRDFPFLNRGIQSTYPPASIFKLIMASAILGEKVISPSATIQCKGFMRLGNRNFWCHKRSGHGFLNLEEAIAQSCNIYFGKVGVKYLGIDVISRYAKAFGLGTFSGIDLDGEVSGIVPGKFWKEKNYNISWTGGDTLNTSIGQGFLSVTPLQIANMIAGIVNDGLIYKPHLLKEVRKSGSNTVLYKTEPEIMHSIDLLKSSDYQYIKRAMRNTVSSGTGLWGIYTRIVDVAGKTGTGEIGTEGRWHDWFAGFAPFSVPQKKDKIVVVSLVEATNAYEWWAPKAFDIVMQGYFSDQNYDEVIEEWQRRKVPWSWDNRDLPPPGMSLD